MKKIFTFFLVLAASVGMMNADPTIFAGFNYIDGSKGWSSAPTESDEMLIDGKFTDGEEGVDWTKWFAKDENKTAEGGTGENCWWVDFSSDDPIAITHYILTVGNDNQPWGEGRNPGSWEIKAKLNAGDAWATIASVTNDATMEDINFKNYTFALSTVGQYKYFRFKVTASRGADCIQICELRFMNDGSYVPTAVDNTAVEAKAVKRIVDGQLFIERDGKTFNAQGVEVK